MLELLLALILISSPAHADLNEEFSVSVMIQDVSNLGAFQLDISFENLELLSVERGEEIKHWSVFDYRLLEGNKVRVIAAKMPEEDSVDEGEILKLKFIFMGDARLQFDGILSRSDGAEIPFEFEENEIEITEMEEIPSPAVTVTVGEQKSTFEKYLFYGELIILLAALLLFLKILRKRVK